MANFNVEQSKKYLASSFARIQIIPLGILGKNKIENKVKLVSLLVRELFITLPYCIFDYIKYTILSVFKK